MVMDTDMDMDMDMDIGMDKDIAVDIGVDTNTEINVEKAMDTVNRHCTANETTFSAGFEEEESVKQLFSFKVSCLSDEATISLLHVNFKAMIRQQ
jgi:hypothetical protein